MKRFGIALLVGPLLALPAAAQDLAVSQIGGGNDYAYYGQDGGLAAYAFATTSCNVGNQVVIWNDNIGQAPVIAQNMFRIHDGRIEQLGYSWLKYGFCAINENSCGNCQNTDCNTLGLGCADTYSSGLNDGQNGGAKFEIDPTDGGPWPNNPTNASGSLPLRGRIQIDVSKIGTLGARYIAESQYVSEEDQTAGNGRNNTSWQRINFPQVNFLQNVGSTILGDPAIFAWGVFDGATINEVVNTNEGGPGIHGYYFLGYQVTDLGGGEWRYEYALQNMTSDRSAGTFNIPGGCENLTISDVYFSDIDHHSGSPYANTDWAYTEGAGTLSWACTPFAQNQNANALRWGTLYNFGFTANQPPAPTLAEIGLFKPGSPTSLFSLVEGPCGECGGQNYCQTSANSVGTGATMGFTGSTSVAANDLSLTATGGPPGKSGLFYYGPSQINIPFGDGVRCVGGETRRLNPNLSFDGSGDMTRVMDYNVPPLNGNPNPIVVGSNYNFQLWYRDPDAMGAGFNFSDGLNLVFCP